jgi:transposase
MDTRAELYAAVLGIRSPWIVTGVQLLAEQEEVRVRIALSPDATVHCPQCRQASPRFDTRARTWRHLDTCQFKTYLTAEIPRVKCQEHGVHQIHVPWAEPGSHFTALFESVVIDWLREGSLRMVARMMDLSWDEVDGIQDRAVRRGLARRKLKAPQRIGVDETSFCKRHEYVTVVTDLDSMRTWRSASTRAASSTRRWPSSRQRGSSTRKLPIRTRSSLTCSSRSATTKGRSSSSASRRDSIRA